MTPAKQLAAFIRKFSPENAALIKGSLKKMRALFPNAVQLVYDNYNFLVVGFGPTEKPSEAIFSLAAFAGGLILCFLQKGPKLKDPGKLLRGAGKVVRNIRLADAGDLDKPEVRALITQALVLAKRPMDESTRGNLIIKSISAKQRPRR